MNSKNNQGSDSDDLCLCLLLGFLFRQIAIVLCFILAIILTPFIILFLLFPIYLLRSTVSLIAKCCRSDLGKILTTRSAIFAVDAIYEQPLTCNVARFISDGRCDLQKIVKLIDQEWLQAKFANGVLKYPELKQSVTQWMGYLFWKNDKKFNVVNHVKIYEAKTPGDYITRLEVHELWNELSMKPFDKHRSPWEILIIPLYLEMEDEEAEFAKSIILFRWHHCLSDGFSILNLLTSVASININTIAKAKADLNSNCCASLWNGISSFFMAPFNILRIVFALSDRNPWHISEKKLTRYWHIALSEGIPMKTIQEIKTAFNVSFTSVILASVAGAMKKFMGADTKVERSKVPKYITCGVPFPLPNHPEKLRNHWAICSISLPVYEENPCKRLQIIDKKIQEMKRTHLPALSHMLMPLLGGLTACLTRKIAKNQLTTLVCSIMPGPPEPLKNYMNSDVLDAMYINGCGPGRNGFSFSAFSFSGNLKFAVAVDSAFSPDDSVAKLLTLAISEELSYFKQSIINSVNV